MSRQPKFRVIEHKKVNRITGAVESYFTVEELTHPWWKLFRGVWKDAVFVVNYAWQDVVFKFQTLDDAMSWIDRAEAQRSWSGEITYIVHER
jgi:hypothetical protein